MFIGDIGISELISWFQRSDFKYLCLYVAGSLNDANFIKDIYNKRETIDWVTGESVCLFLFANGIDTTISLGGMNYGGDVTSGTIPGYCWTSNNYFSNFSSSFNRSMNIYERYDKKVINVEEFNARKHSPELAERIIRKSQTIGEEISKYFTIDESELPCIILIDNSQRSNYFNVRVRKHPSIERLFNLLKDLKLIIKNLTTTSQEVNYYYDTINKYNENLGNSKKLGLKHENILEKLNGIKPYQIDIENEWDTFFSYLRSNGITSIELFEHIKNNFNNLKNFIYGRKYFTKEEKYIAKDLLLKKEFLTMIEKMTERLNEYNIQKHKEGVLIDELNDVNKTIALLDIKIEEQKSFLEQNRSHQSELLEKTYEELSVDVEKLMAKYDRWFIFDNIIGKIINTTGFKNAKDISTLLGYI